LRGEELQKETIPGVSAGHLLHNPPDSEVATQISLQGLHVIVPFKFLFATFPASHGIQILPATERRPRGHGTHAVLLAFELVFARHFVQLKEPWLEYCPTGHFVHSVPLKYAPAGQVIQLALEQPRIFLFNDSTERDPDPDIDELYSCLYIFAPFIPGIGIIFLKSVV